MNCPTCGEDCRCFPEPSSAIVSPEVPDAEIVAAPAPVLVPEIEEPANQSGVSDMADSAWRDELSERLNRYRARRKPRPPRYPSLRLAFDAPRKDTNETSLPAFETVSNQALALDGLTEVAPSVEANEIVSSGQIDPAIPSASESALATPAPQNLPARNIRAKSTRAKILEFPRAMFGPPPTTGNELAEPVFNRPRILEVPEFELPPPALGGITMEAPPKEDPQRQPGIDLPLQSAPVTRRIVAAAVDGLIITLASAIFGAIFWKITSFRPPMIQLLTLAAGIPFVFWAAYQYLLMVYSAGTPGLRAAGLELTRFDGSPAPRRVRRWRVLASYLSAVSLGMGYAWLALDEDVLCWHDRITRTYLAPRKRQASSNTEAGGLPPRSGSDH